MWNLSSNRLSYIEYKKFKNELHMNHNEIMKEANKLGKQCNSNLCTLYKYAIPKKDYILFRDQKITPKNITICKINKAYLPYLKEHFGINHKRNTIITNDINLSNTQKQTIIGAILGDGHIPKKCNYLVMTHGAKQEEYIRWKTRILKTIINTEIKQHCYIDKRIGKKLSNWYIKTLPHKFISDIKNSFYKQGKIISLEHLESLDNFGLAVWYCDDGSIMRQKARICTNCFDKKELIDAIEIMKQKFKFQKIWINSDNILVFSSNDTCLLKKIIKPHVPECMIYKLEN